MDTAELRDWATTLIRMSRPVEADLLSRAAVMIDGGETDAVLAAGLVRCAKHIEARLPGTARQMRDAALMLILIK
jgi:hypothetical protein